jgi:hypothetical protein
VKGPTPAQFSNEPFLFWSVVPPLMANWPSNHVERVFTASPSLELKWTVGMSLSRCTSGAANVTVLVA